MQQQCRAGILFLVATATVGLFAACDRVADATASATRTASPSVLPPATTPPDATLLTGSNCSAAPASTQPRLLAGYYKIRPAPNWADTGNYQRTETLFLELTAPDTYGFAPTRIHFGGGDVGPVHTIYGPAATAHSIAQQHAAAIAKETSPNAVAGTVRDCRVGGEPAAAYGFSNGILAGFYVYFVHNDGLYLVLLAGTGGLGSPAIHDSLEMIGSLTWAS
jgi:hypothetical protein